MYIIAFSKFLIVLQLIQTYISRLDKTSFTQKSEPKISVKTSCTKNYKATYILFLFFDGTFGDLGA